MRRYYLCDVIGSGTRLDPYRAVVANLGVSFVAVLNAPASMSALVLVSAADHTTLLAHPQVDALPDMSLEARWDTLSPAVRAALAARITARSLSTAGIVGSVTFRAVLRLLGRQLRSEFDEAAFEVS